MINAFAKNNVGSPLDDDARAMEAVVREQQLRKMSDEKRQMVELEESRLRALEKVMIEKLSDGSREASAPIPSEQGEGRERKNEAGAAKAEGSWLN